MSGRLVGSEEALRIGLVNRVVPGESLLDEAAAFAKELVEGPPMTIRGPNSPSIESFGKPITPS